MLNGDAVQGEKTEKGQCVSVKGETSSGEIEEWFAIIHDLRGSKTKGWAHVIWMEGAKAIPYKLRPRHRESEMFLTLKEAVIDVASINCVTDMYWVENIRYGLAHPHWRKFFDTDKELVLVRELICS